MREDTGADARPMTADHSILPAAQVRALVARVKRARKAGGVDEEARDLIARHHTRLVLDVVNDYLRSVTTLTERDLLHFGYVGLMRAVYKYSPKKGGAFSTVATWWIRHEIGQAVKTLDRVVRVSKASNNLLYRARRLQEAAYGRGEVLSTRQALRLAGASPDLAEHLAAVREVDSLDAPASWGPEGDSDSTLGEVIPDPSAPNLEADAEASDRADVLAAALGQLPPEVAEIVRRRAILGEGVGKVGRDLRIKRPEVSRLYEAGLQALRSRLGNDRRRLGA